MLSDYAIITSRNRWFAAQGEVYWTADEGNGFNQLTQETLHNGLVTHRSYDAVTGWLKSIQTGASGGSGVQNLAYTWDLIGNLSSRKDINQSNLTEEFSYDNLYRLTEASLSTGPSTTFDFDLLGNITNKSDVGDYTYHSTKRHQVTSTSNGWSFGYDANGNMTSGRGATIDWTSYNYPSCIRLGSSCSGTSSDYAAFSYTPDRQYWKQVSNYASTGAATTIYVGGLLEKVTTSAATDYRHMIRAGNSTIIVSRQTSGTNSVYYVTSDHLGSSSAITNSSGGILVNESFDAFGRRRGSNWSSNPSAGDWTTIASTTRQGFTGHTMLDNLNLIHMKGRVFDPALGRFLRADPNIPYRQKTQSFNRYSYVRNNPMSFVDPSGFEDIEEITVVGTRHGDNSTDPRWTDTISGWEVNAPDTAGPDREGGGDLEEIVVTAKKVKCISIGFNGAGGPDAGGNPDFSNLLRELGAKEAPGNFGNFNNSSQANEATDSIQQQAQGFARSRVTIFGYSRGGNTSVVLSNDLAARGIPSTVITIDPHNMVGNLALPKGSTGLNFYQQNPRSWTGGLGWWGKNPYNGSPVDGAENILLTDPRVTHLNIVQVVAAPNGPYRKKIDEIAGSCQEDGGDTGQPTPK